MRESTHPRLNDGAVDDRKAEDKDHQCRNWPDHGSRIDSKRLDNHPSKGEVAATGEGRFDLAGVLFRDEVVTAEARMFGVPTPRWVSTSTEP